MKLAIFDFNGTIFPQETMPFILKEWYRQGYPRFKLVKVFSSLLPLYLKYKMFSGGKDMEIKAVKGVSRIFTGMKKDDVQKFFQKAAESASKSFNSRVIAEIKNNFRKKDRLLLLSGAFDLFLEEVASILDIDTVLASKLPFHNEKAQPSSREHIIRGKQKLEVLQDHFQNKDINWKKSTAYADSIHDLPLLEMVGEPVTVNPDDELAQIAQNKNWPVIR
ncbi:MAG: HAD family hydrolase [bacterium]